MNERTRRKAASHQAIRTAASRMIRGEGLNATTVHEVMRRSGLTVGGFYAHYHSRGELVRDAFCEAVRERREHVRGFLDGRPREEWLPRFVDQYLSGLHMDDREGGCAWAALLSELPRADLATRRDAQRQFMSSVDALARTLPARPPAARPGRNPGRTAEPPALTRREAALSSMALAFAHLDLARMVVDPGLKVEILAAGRKAARVLAGAARPVARSARAGRKMGSGRTTGRARTTGSGQA